MTKHEKYLQWAESGATIFSTCAKAQYMALVVDRYGIVVATGYNGVPSGFKHCKDGGCPRADTEQQGGSYDNCSARHAEANALLFSSPQQRDGGTLYVNGLPCWECAKLIIDSGLIQVVYKGGRKPVDESQVLELFNKSKVNLVEMS